MKRIFFFTLIIISAAIVFCETLPTLVNPQDINSESELDNLQNFFHSDWIWDWLKAENAFRITGGSLNIRHIFHERSAKMRFTLMEDTFWFRYRHTIRELIQDDWRTDEIELEYSPVDRLYVSFFGDPVYRKYDIDIGWSVRYGTSEDNSLSVSYVLVDFDNNYAFHDTSVNEGFERFYRKAPIEWRMKIVSALFPVKFWAEGFHRRSWTREYIDLNTPANNRIDIGREYMLEGQLRWDMLPGVSPYVDYLGRYTRKGQFFNTPRPDGDHIRWEKRVLVHPKILYKVHEKCELDLGIRLVQHTGEDVYPGNGLKTKRFKNTNIIPFVNSIIHLKGSTSLELGYMYAEIDEEKFESRVLSKELNIDNRLRLGVIIDFNENAHLKIITGWDFDDEDVDRFQLFDGGYIQFQARL